MLVINSIKPKDHDLIIFLFHKTKLGMSFFTRIISSARIILLPIVLSEIDFMYSIKESENKGAEYISCNGKFSDDEQGEIWIKCFSWTLPEQRTHSISGDFYK